MSDLDHTLIHRVRQLIAGDNAHRANTWLFLYEKSRAGSADRREYEALLRRFVGAHGNISVAARSYAESLCAYSVELHRKSDVLNAALEQLNNTRRGSRSRPDR